MKINTLYKYLGVNGILVTPILLKDVYHIEEKELIAKDGYLLTKDQENFYSSIIVPEFEVNEWYEVPA